jgi:hypothetical protein
VIDCFGDARVTRGIEAPFEVVALDEDGARHFALSAALPFRTRVDEQRAALGDCTRCFLGRHALETRAGVGEHLVDA